MHSGHSRPKQRHGHSGETSQRQMGQERSASALEPSETADPEIPQNKKQRWVHFPELEAVCWAGFPHVWGISAQEQAFHWCRPYC